MRFFGAAQTWQDLTGREIKYMNIDVAQEYELLLQLFKDYKPDTVSRVRHRYWPKGATTLSVNIIPVAALM